MVSLQNFCLQSCFVVVLLYASIYCNSLCGLLSILLCLSNSVVILTVSSMWIFMYRSFSVHFKV
jgi:hypothetical protein